MPAKGVKIDPDKMDAASRVLDSLFDVVAKPRAELYPLTFSIGAFSAGDSLRTVIESGTTDWELALANLGDACVAAGGAVSNAKMLLRDADESNDPFVLDDINEIVS
ncbi:hypothetical protein ACIBTV_24585 [Micromonospora sp. NPDC049366]|uniref:hypothetical protein n=1 Tax=Micromonospora sp. NPDC049366 TaxID=3364271 RepID=UPI00378BCB1D